MRVQVLGPVTVTRDENALVLGGPRQRAVLAVLLVAASRVVPVDRLIDEVWGGSPPAGGRDALYVYVSNLRRLLGPDRLTHIDNGYQLRIEPRELDAVEFEDEVAQAHLLVSGEPGRAVEILEGALGRWQGDAYQGIDLPSVSAEATRLNELRLGAIEDHLEARLALGQHHQATGELAELCDKHPLRERLWGLSMLALYRDNRQAEALAAYQQLRTQLGEELGIEPSPELQQLEEQILLQDPRLELVAAIPHNLPAPLTSFVGRELELIEVGQLLTDARLVTLTGPGGSGKTRLALETARRVAADYGDGVWLIDLASLDDPTLVAGRVAGVLGVKNEPDQSISGRVGTFLADRQVLLVLDNCEHLVEAVAGLSRELLERADGLKILATSRELLGVPGEIIYQVEALSVPSANDEDSAVRAGSFDAVRLFVERGETARPGFALTDSNAPEVGQICRRLDGMPLALELAATRLRALSPEQIAAHLDDRFRLLTGGGRAALPRQRTLRAAIDWSYDRLAEPEQQVFNRLSVFSGGFNLEAAEAVCAGDPIDREAILALLGRLVDRSLVATTLSLDGSVRYRLLESLRDYARLWLDKSGQTSPTRQRHAAFYRQWASARGAPLHWPQDEAEMQGWRVEVDNLRAALTWALETGDADTALSIGAATWRFWCLEGAYTEGLDWLERSLVLAESAVGLDPIVVLRGTAALSHELGKFDAAQAYNMRAIELAAGEPGEEAQLQLVSVLANLGEIRVQLSDYAGAASLFEEAFRIGELIDHPHLGRLCFNRGMNALCLEDLPAAREFFTNAPRYHDAFGNFRQWGLPLLRWIEGDLAGARVSLDTFHAGGGIGQTLADGHLLAALLARDEGRPDLALEELAECLPRIRHAGSGHLSTPAMLAWWLLVAATVHTKLDQPELAARLAGAAAGALEKGTWVLPGWVRRDRDRYLDQIRSQMDQNDFDQALEEGRTLTVEAACLEALASGAEPMGSGDWSDRSQSR